MKTISLYTNNGSWLTQLHPFTKLWYLAAAICIPLLTGSLWGFAVMIIISFVLLKSGRLIKKALPLIAFSFTIILTIFLIHGLYCLPSDFSDFIKKDYCMQRISD